MSAFAQVSFPLVDRVMRLRQPANRLLKREKEKLDKFFTK